MKHQFSGPVFTIILTWPTRSRPRTFVLSLSIDDGQRHIWSYLLASFKIRKLWKYVECKCIYKIKFNHKQQYTCNRSNCDEHEVFQYNFTHKHWHSYVLKDGEAEAPSVGSLHVNSPPFSPLPLEVGTAGGLGYCPRNYFWKAICDLVLSGGILHKYIYLGFTGKQSLCYWDPYWGPALDPTGDVCPQGPDPLENTGDAWYKLWRLSTGVTFSGECISLLWSTMWPNVRIDQDGTWHGDRPRLRPHCAKWGPSSPQKGAHPPQFSAHVYCGQTAGWIKMPLGTKGLGPGHIVLHGDPAPPKGTQLSSILGPCLLWPVSYTHLTLPTILRV